MDKPKEEESIPKWRLFDFHTSFDMHGNILDIEKDEWVSPNLLYYCDFSAEKGNGEGEKGRCYVYVWLSFGAIHFPTWEQSYHTWIHLDFLTK